MRFADQRHLRDFRTLALLLGRRGKRWRRLARSRRLLTRVRSRDFEPYRTRLTDDFAERLFHFRQTAAV